jgi:hypothetical protein
LGKKIRGALGVVNDKATDIPSVDDIKSRYNEAKESIIDFKDDVKGGIDTIRGTANEVEDTFNQAKDTYNDVK